MSFYVVCVLQNWTRSSCRDALQERGRIINKFADLLEEHTDELAALDSCAADTYDHKSPRIRYAMSGIRGI